MNQYLSHSAPPLRGSRRDEGASPPSSRRGGYKIAALGKAKSLRKNMTEAEQKLWFSINRKQLENLKFRRQQPIENYIVDFYSAEARLIIEIDGEQHAQQEAHDQKRTEFLNSKGYSVLRFWNNDVLNNTAAVLETIRAAITPHASNFAYGSFSAAPPQGGSEGL